MVDNTSGVLVIREKLDKFPYNFSFLQIKFI